MHRCMGGKKKKSGQKTTTNAYCNDNRCTPAVGACFKCHDGGGLSTVLQIQEVPDNGSVGGTLFAGQVL